MNASRPTFDHLCSGRLGPADCPPGTPFAHLLGTPPAAATVPSDTAAAIIAAGEHALRAREASR